jgi:[NiFe] hydrogenase assembly HybE family chaperone
MSTAPAHDDPVAARVARLAAAYAEVDTRMRGLPICNPRLRVEPVGFRSSAHGLFGVMITPWVVSGVLLADPMRSSGGTRRLELPSGGYDFIAAALGSFGVVETCSLLSPVLQLADQSAARAFAAVALRAMLEPPEPPAALAAASAVTSPAVVGRRGLLGDLFGAGRRTTQGSR